MSRDYDAVVMGSGIGGLTCGAFLARAGLKVLVLEQHYQFGGYAHSFRRRGFRFEAGIHSVPMSNDGLIMHMLRLLGVDRMIETVTQDEMFSVQMPGLRYSMPVLPNDIVGKLKADFPHEKQGLQRLLDDMRHFYDVLARPIFSFEENFVEEDKQFVSRYHNRSYRDYIDSFVGDQRLRNIFYSQWPYGGTAPDCAPTVFYVMMYIIHFMEGSDYVQGGMCKLVDALVSVIEGSGGAVRKRSMVEGVLTDQSGARAVRLSNGETFEGRVFVSNISPYALHRRIIEGSARKGVWLRRLNALQPSVSSLAVYCGLNKDIGGIFKHNIHFWFAHDNYEQVYRNMVGGNVDAEDHLILLKPTAEETPSLTLLRFAERGAEENWKEAKMRHAESMLAQAERLFPGVRDATALTEVGSPTTFERYTLNTDGALYGFENTCDMYGEAKLPIKTYVKNLYQTGHWGRPGGGVWNVMSNAYTTSKLILRDIG